MRAGYYVGYADAYSVALVGDLGAHQNSKQIPKSKMPKFNF